MVDRQLIYIRTVSWLLIYISDLASSTITYNYPNFSIGIRDPSAFWWIQDPFTGNIGIIEINDHALSASEITDNFNATKAKYN